MGCAGSDRCGNGFGGGCGRTAYRNDLAALLFSGAADTASIDIWRALAELPPALREVTVLFYFDDLKTEEIAGILSIPHATVRTRLARARERLRALLGDYSDTAANEERKSYVM